MNGISNPSLTAGKMVVHGNAHKLSYLDVGQQYFYTLVELAKTAMGNGVDDCRHKISMVKHRKTQNKQQKQKKLCIHAGHYKMKEWNDLKDDGNAQVQNFAKRKRPRAKQPRTPHPMKRKSALMLRAISSVLWQPPLLHPTTNCLTPPKHPTTSTPVTKGTVMNDDMLVMDNDNEPPATASALTKWAKPHPESDSDSNAKPTTATTANPPMKSSARDFLGCCAHHAAQHKLMPRCLLPLSVINVICICSWCAGHVMICLAKARQFLTSRISLLSKRHSA